MQVQCTVERKLPTLSVIMKTVSTKFIFDSFGDNCMLGIISLNDGLHTICNKKMRSIFLIIIAIRVNGDFCFICDEAMGLHRYIFGSSMQTTFIVNLVLNTLARIPLEKGERFRRCYEFREYNCRERPNAITNVLKNKDSSLNAIYTRIFDGIVFAIVCFYSSLLIHFSLDPYFSTDSSCIKSCAAFTEPL